MVRQGLPIVLVLLATALAPSVPAVPPARADPSPRTLVLPLRSIGVSDATTLVSRDLLAGSLQDLGVDVARADSTQPPLPVGSEACDDPACAAALARQHGAVRVVYGSLSQLGGKVIARLDVLRVGEAAPYYRDQLTATSEEDLDQVMRRFAEGIAAGRPNSSRASVESVTQAETMTPARRATRAGLGVRAGFLFPTSNSFGGADRLTSLSAVYKCEMPNFQFESTTLLGFTWGRGNYDWTIFDLRASRIFGSKDLSTYLGAGIGVHSVTVEQQRSVEVSAPPGPSYTFEAGFRQTETVPAADLMVGLMAMRTYDFEIVFEVRYHYVFERFNQVGGAGAQGVMVSFGTNR
jgi:hypothetical protein